MYIQATSKGKSQEHANACFISALSNATSMTYEEAFLLCVEYGFDGGMPHQRAYKLFKQQGLGYVSKFKWKRSGASIIACLDHPSNLQFPAMTVGRLVDLCKARKGAFIVFTDDHALCVNNGEVYDTGLTKKSKRVAMMFSIK